MSSGHRLPHRLPTHRQPWFSLTRLTAIIIGSIIILSCSAPSKKTTTFAQNSPDPSASTFRREDVDSETVRSLALRGDAEAQYQLAKRSAIKHGKTGDYAQAWHWWHQAAEQGLAKAQFALGVLYANGRGIHTDYARAAHWYHKAADQGLAEAQYNLGMHYWLGKGVPRNAAAAVTWLRKAADQGLPQAQYNLGLLLEGGLGAPRDLKEARVWYTRAAAQGLPEAQRELQGSPGTLATTPSLP